jgi:hypothetical protein
MTTTRRIVAVLGAVALIGGATVAMLLRGGAPHEGQAPVVGRDAASAARPSFADDDPQPAPDADGTSAETLVPKPARITIRLPPHVRAAGEVLVSVTSERLGLLVARTVNPEAVWEDLPPGEYGLATPSPGWAVPEERLDLAPGARATVEMKPRNGIEGIVVGARSGRPVEDLSRLSVIGRVMDQDGLETARDLLTDAMHLPGGALRIAGLDLGDVDAVRFAAAAADEEAWFTDWMPMPPQPFWSDVLVPVAELVVHGRVTTVEPPQGPVRDATVVLVPPDVALRDVRFAGENLYLAPARPGDREPSLRGVAHTDGAGEFAMRTVHTATEARVLAWAPGRLPSLSPVVGVPLGDPPVEVNLALGHGGEVRVLVHAAARPTAEGTEVQVDEEPRRVSLEPLEGGLVSSTGALTEWLRRCDGALPGEVDYDARFTSVTPGEYLVSALLMSPERDDQGRVLRGRVVVTEGAFAQVELRWNDPASGVTLRGRAVLPADFELGESDVSLVRRGAPIDGATLPQAMDHLQPDGRFELSGVMPGEHVILIHAYDRTYADLAVGVAPVSVGDSPLPELRLDLSAPEIRVRAPADLRTWRVRLASQTASAELDALLALDYIGVKPADETGDARLFGLPPGRYTLKPTCEPPRNVEFEVGNGPLTIELR